MAQTIANPEPAKVISRAGECMRRLFEAGLTFDDLQQPINDPALRQRLVQFWKGNLPAKAAKGYSITAGYPVIVDYDRPLESMVEEGRYNWKNSDINAKNFPVEFQGKAEVKIQLVHFNRFVESGRVLRNLEEQALRPATLAELLAFGAQYPEEQRKSAIVALFSVWEEEGGTFHVPLLWTESAKSSKRILDLEWFEFGWDTNYSFAAVRK